MESIDVSDLPEPFAQAVKAVAETFRRALAVRRVEKGDEPKKTPVELPHWPLGVIGNLTRGQIDDDRFRAQLLDRQGSNGRSGCHVVPYSEPVP